MEPFKNLSISDQERINHLLSDSFYYQTYTSSELVFENIFAWNYAKQIEVMWIDESIGIIRSLEKNGVYIFFPPICRTTEQFIQGMEFIKQNYPRNIVGGLSKTMVDICQNLGCLFLYDDYYSEYIYDPCQLAEMKGGKFSRKRNLIAQFHKKYQSDFVPFSMDYYDKVVAFLNRYQQQGGSSADFDALLYVLKNGKELHYFCDLLISNDLVIGLSIGTISVFGHAVILFEKSDFDYVGSGAALVQLAAVKHYSACKSLTRQEDLGLPQLRKAKLSLNPISKERKYACVFDPLTMQLYELYLKTFSDSQDYVDFFFLHTYDKKNVYYVEKENKVASALHILMKKMVFNNQVFDLPFIVAASTDERYRRQGLMREVMAKTFTGLRKQGHLLVSLYPVDPAFYYPYGFVHYTTSISLSSYEEIVECGLEQTTDCDLLADMYSHCVQANEGFVIRDKDYYEGYLNSLWQDGVVFDLIKHGEETIGYVAHKDGEVDEVLLCGNQRPVHKDIDFAKAEMPHPEGDIPKNMIRVLDIVKLLQSLKISSEEKLDINVRITDEFIAENNTIVRLLVSNGRIGVTPADEAQLSVSIEEITQVIFGRKTNARLSFLYPKKRMVSFDKF